MNSMKLGSNSTDWDLKPHRFRMAFHTQMLHGDGNIYLSPFPLVHVAILHLL